MPCAVAGTNLGGTRHRDRAERGGIFVEVFNILPTMPFMGRAFVYTCLASTAVVTFLVVMPFNNPSQPRAETDAASVTKAELVEHLAEKRKMARRHAEIVVDAIFACMEQSLRRGERIEIRGFGTFQVRSYKGYEGRNPKTGNVVHVAPKRLPFFKVSKNLVAMIDAGRKMKGSMESVQS
jgi:integration host factor subunit beta